MKIHCPHCGVKGSVNESYHGKNVKCPKCSGIFEAAPKETVSETGADLASEKAALSSVPEKKSAQSTEKGNTAASVRKTTTYSMTNPAPKIKLHVTKNIVQTAPDEKINEPVSSIELEEIIVTDSSVNEPEKDGLSHENGTHGIAEIDESDGIEIIDEAEAITAAEDILNEPYGMKKEQCWQCGKKDNGEKPFIAQNGRLYCDDCAPAENIVDIIETDKGKVGPEFVQSCAVKGFATEMDKTAAGSFSTFSIRGALREAWAKTQGAKTSIWAGSAIMYLILFVLFAGSAYLSPPLTTDQLPNTTAILTNVLFQTVTDIISVIFVAGLFYLGIRKVARQSISWKMIFKGFSCTGSLITVFFLQGIIIIIGFLLFILPGIYLSIGYLMAVPLIVDKGLSPWQALETSRKAIHKVWWKVAGLFILMGCLIFLSMIPLCIGLIWSWPMSIILVGVMYHHLFSAQKQ